MKLLPGLTFLETVLIAIIVPLIVSRYIGTYNDFRKEIIETRRHFKLYSNIYYHSFLIDEIDDNYFRKIIAVQEALRIIWVDLESKYLLIPPELRRILILFRKIPNKSILETILSNLLAIHNSTIVYRLEIDETQYGRNERKERNELIKEVEKIVELYV